ncbi:MAG: META domain-containing protein [Acidobacteriota bacterium]
MRLSAKCLDQDRRIQSAIRLAAGISVLLMGASGGWAFAPKPVPQPMENTYWVYRPTGTGSGVFASGGKQVTLFLDPLKKVAIGSGGCNTFSIPYTLKRGKITFGKLTSTDMSCGPVDADEAGYFRLLSGAVKYQIMGNTLSLLGNDGTVTGTFRSSPLDPGGVPQD